MALDFAAYDGPAVPGRLFYPGGIKTQLKTTGAGVIIWSDGTEQSVAANHQIPTWEGNPQFDNRTLVWLVVAVKGGDLALYREVDTATVIAGIIDTYAILFRVVDRVEYFQQC